MTTQKLFYSTLESIGKPINSVRENTQIKNFLHMDLTIEHPGPQSDKERGAETRAIIEEANHFPSV
jgi:hypothetical protein